MAMFRVGDVVTFTNMMYGLQNVNGKIIKILKDTERGDAFDSYNIESQWRGGLKKFVLRNKHIHNLVAGAEQEGLVQNPIPQPAVRAQFRGFLADPFIPENAPEDVWAAQQELEKIRQIKIEEEMRQEGVKKPPVKKQNKAVNWAQYIHDRVQYVEPNNGEEVPKPAPINIDEEKPKINLKDFEKNGLLPEYILYTENKFAIPVFDRVKARRINMGITAADYEATNLMAERYYVFKTNEGHTLQPKYDPYTKSIYFQCAVTGNVYYNHHQKPGIHVIDEKVGDTEGQIWTSKTYYIMYQKKGVLAAAVAALNPKRKLRQKYQEMPQIKEEKHYDSKDYIA